MKAIFWDTCGQERYRSVAHSFFRGAGVVILVYDCANEDSFDNIRVNWARDLETHMGEASKVRRLRESWDLFKIYVTFFRM